MDCATDSNGARAQEVAENVQRSFAYLDGLAGQLEEASGDGHHPGVLGVERSQERRGVAVEVLLVVDETLGEEGYVSRDEVVYDGALAAVLLHERYPQLAALNGVQHLPQAQASKTGWTASDVINR